MAKITIPKGIVKDIIIVAVGALVIWGGIQVAFGTSNPFYVVASGSMIPVLEVYDVLIVSGHVPFEEIGIGDIIVFNRPSDHDRVIVHRVVSIISDNPKIIRTQGDANPASIPGTDFPITDEEYIGKVAYTLPQVGYITQFLKPPINYILIAVVIGIMVAKQIIKKKKEKKLPFTDPLTPPKPNTTFSDTDKIKKDLEYSEHVEKTKDVGELDDTDEVENFTKTNEISDKFDEIGDAIKDKPSESEESQKKEKTDS